MRCNHQLSHWYLAEADFDRSGSVFWYLRVAEGDHLTERSEGRKLPQHKTRALAVLRKLKTLLGGAPGGVQRGPRRGTAPNRPPLPHAGKAKSHAGKASQPRHKAKHHAQRPINKKNEPQHKPRPVIKVWVLPS